MMNKDIAEKLGKLCYEVIDKCDDALISAQDCQYDLIHYKKLKMDEKSILDLEKNLNDAIKYAKDVSKYVEVAAKITTDITNQFGGSNEKN